LDYKKISIRRDVYEKLVELKEKRGFTSINDVISHLLAMEDIHATISSMFEKYHATLSSILEKQHATNSSMVSEAHATQSSMKTEQHATKSSKKTAVEILREVKVRCISDMRSARNPEAIIEKMKAGGAVVVRTEEDVCAVDPEYWGFFKRKLNESKTPDDKEILSRLKDEKMKKLFQLLRKAGALYLDAKTKEWVYDYSFVEEPGKREDVEEEAPPDWELA
jgi:predicted CopG family antitoxin